MGFLGDKVRRFAANRGMPQNAIGSAMGQRVVQSSPVRGGGGFGNLGQFGSSVHGGGIFNNPMFQSIFSKLPGGIVRGPGHASLPWPSSRNRGLQGNLLPNRSGGIVGPDWTPEVGKQNLEEFRRRGGFGQVMKEYGLKPGAMNRPGFPGAKPPVGPFPMPWWAGGGGGPFGGGFGGGPFGGGPLPGPFGFGGISPGGHLPFPTNSPQQGPLINPIAGFPGVIPYDGIRQGRW